LTEKEIDLLKDEHVKLLNNTNKDWWFVEKENGDKGYVPSTYMRVYDVTATEISSKMNRLSDEELEQESEEDTDEEEYFDNDSDQTEETEESEEFENDLDSNKGMQLK
jgi:uncharacterized protein YgiM (DUF1202 family)